MERDQEPRRFFCKFCDESFSNGRVLGGHMRSHLGPNSTKGKKKIDIENDDSGYVLRENPKKSWKFSGSGGGGANLCQVCGKGFESLRALFGHLRHHSTRERKSIHCTECGKGFATPRALTGHMRWHPERVRVRNGNVTDPEPGLGPSSSQVLIGDNLSDENERSGPVRKKRSKRVMRYKNFSNSCSFSDINESSSVTGAEQEVEDVAMCLMMLSRGVRSWADYVSVCESSENNYVHQSQLVVRTEGGDESLSFSVKVDSCVSDSVNVVSGKRKLELWENDSGFVFKKPKLDDGSVSVMFGAEVEEKVHSADPEMLEKKQYKCRICSKCFDTHQALGGHCNAHKLLLKSCSALKAENCDGDTQTTVSSESEPNYKLVEYECDETSDEHEISSSVNVASNEVKKSKVHECPVCFRVFRSGQALGGHKRAHFYKVVEVGKKDEEQDQELEQHPYDDEALRLKQWWGGSNYSQEALVGV